MFVWQVFDVWENWILFVRDVKKDGVIYRWLICNVRHERKTSSIWEFEKAVVNNI